MKTNRLILLSLLIAGFFTFTLVSCKKDVAPEMAPVVEASKPISFTEEFTDVSKLAAAGWVIKNNSNPQGSTAWRQGLYENNYNSKTGLTVGFPAFSSETSPYDFISVDATAVNSKGEINCWLITPTIMVKNGDSIQFMTRAMDDIIWPNYAVDRMQVRANFNDGSADCGTTSNDFGKFTRLIFDINPTYLTNDPGGNSSGLPGFPRTWARGRWVVTGLPGTTAIPARFGFRYMALNGGINGTTASSVVGVDQFIFGSK
jgi:hypothetical protein